MARPRNLVVVRNGVVLSVTPKNLKEFLKNPSVNTLTGTSLGQIAADLTDVSDTEVGASLIESLGLADSPLDVPPEILAIVNSANRRGHAEPEARLNVEMVDSSSSLEDDVGG
jgi:hypothetical protein